MWLNEYAGVLVMRLSGVFAFVMALMVVYEITAGAFSLSTLGVFIFLLLGVYLGDKLSKRTKRGKRNN